LAIPSSRAAEELQLALTQFGSGDRLPQKRKKSRQANGSRKLTGRRQTEGRNRSEKLQRKLDDENLNRTRKIFLNATRFFNLTGR
jgi:hypothetical protein